MNDIKHIYVSAAALLASVTTLGACQSLPTHQGPRFGPPVTQSVETEGYESGKYVLAEDFLGPDWMSSALHTVEPQAYNDGYANSYKIITPDYTYVVQGTEQTKRRIHEIEATERLRRTPTLAAAAQSFKARSKNLVTTPYRAAISGKARYQQAQSSENGLKSASSGFGGVMVKLGHGIKELGVTGIRITTSAGGSSCVGISCVGEAGKDIWSGINSLVGKNAAAVRLHQRIGTDPYSDNRILQREVSRLAYAESYMGTTYKFAVAGAGIPVVSVLAKGVGYYNNIEFTAQYEDAHKRRNREKAQLKDWGIRSKTIKTLYRNKSFSHTSRTRLIIILSKIGNMDVRTRLITEASDTPTRYIAESRLTIYDYLAEMDQSGVISGYVQDTTMVIAVKNNDTLVLPFSADYLQWTRDIAGPVRAFAELGNSGARPLKKEIHMLGKTSPAFKTNARKLGVRVVEIKH
ncbi:MAG: hypothetical protein COA69_12530 [Robiginitomaculum sp.]|nr:MAG: hypothetical protein COA69_12530 [Robiginitomaculum sp.]